MTQLLRDLGILAVSLSQLERERPGTPHASLKAYYDSLGPAAPGEPCLVVRISSDGDMRFRKAADEEAAKYVGPDADVTIWELPEDEFHFFQAFRPALFDLEKRLPPFLLGMALVHSYMLFEDYVAYVVRRRLTQHPRQLGDDKQVTYGEVLDSTSRETLIASLVDREVQHTMYLPIGAVLERLRSRLGFRTLSAEYDQPIVRLSLIRNAIIHNGAKVSPQIAAVDATLVVGEDLHVDSSTVSEAIGLFRQVSVRIDRLLESF